MTDKLIVLGHGPDKNSNFDPGASGNGLTEAGWLRGVFLTSLKKYAGNNVDFYEQNMYANREAKTITGYKEIIELHLDAASSSATGGHVILYKGYKPDEMDNRLGKIIEKYFGLRGGKMFDNRDNLFNLNTFASRKISYRLLELGFITNKVNMDHFKKNYDVIAKELIQGILNVEYVEPVIEKEVKGVSTGIVLTPGQQKAKDVLVKHGMMAADYEFNDLTVLTLVTMLAPMVSKLEANGVLK